MSTLRRRTAGDGWQTGLIIGVLGEYRGVDVCSGLGISDSKFFSTLELCSTKLDSEFDEENIKLRLVLRSVTEE